jgi:hypothetical protein
MMGCVGFGGMVPLSDMTKGLGTGTGGFRTLASATVTSVYEDSSDGIAGREDGAGLGGGSSSISSDDIVTSVYSLSDESPSSGSSGMGLQTWNLSPILASDPIPSSSSSGCDVTDKEIADADIWSRTAMSLGRRLVRIRLVASSIVDDTSCPFSRTSLQ